MDRNDEFISYETVAAMIADERLDQWKIVDVEKDPPVASLYAHHLLIDEATVGKVMWSKMEAALLSHLIPQTTNRSVPGK